MRRALLCAALAAVPATAFAQAPAFPVKPIRLIAPFAPGGALDLVARVVGQVVTEQLGQTVIVDNRAGAAGAIGSEQVARAAPDGYTLLLGATTTHGINPVLQKLTYDPTCWSSIRRCRSTRCPNSSGMRVRSRA
jgi:tripartite-type tricarboxylate transporter receptor subunit TctC